jgi:hypothetical protein
MSAMPSVITPAVLHIIYQENARFSPCHEACIPSFETRIAKAVGAGLGLA